MKEDADQDELEDWDDWRPREDESLNHVRKKTVEKACVNENAVESDGKTAVETAGEAVGDMGRAVEQAAKGRKDEASEKGREAAKEMVLSLDTVARKGIRRLETAVYRYIVTRTNPQYFDSDAVSATLQRKQRLTVPGRKDRQTYALSVELHDSEVRDRCREQLTAETRR